MAEVHCIHLPIYHAFVVIFNNLWLKSDILSGWLPNCFYRAKFLPNTSLFPLFFYIPGYQKRSKNPCQMVHYSISVYDPRGICKTCIKSINLCKRPASNWYLSVVKDHLLNSWFIYLVSNDLNKLACMYVHIMYICMKDLASRDRE